MAALLRPENSVTFPRAESPALSALNGESTLLLARVSKTITGGRDERSCVGNAGPIGVLLPLTSSRVHFAVKLSKLRSMRSCSF